MKTSFIKQFSPFIFLLLVSSNIVAQVVITSINPVNGPVGSTVVISGSNFDSTPSNNVVWFGATQATVVSGNSLSLTVTVPAGATFSPVSVLNLTTRLSAQSKTNFLPTYSPNSGDIIVSDFSQRLSFFTSSGPSAIAVGDLDGDGLSDIAVSTTISNVVTLLRNTSNAGLISFAPRINIAVGQTPSDITVGDIDGDGKPDLVVANPNSNTVSVLRNTSTIGNLSFVRRDLTGTSGVRYVAIADFDADGKFDIAAVSNSGVGSVFRNLSTPGNIAFASKMDVQMGTVSTGIVTGDLDGDGKPDLATSNLGARLSVVRNISTAGNISFAGKTDVLIESSSRSLTIGDFNDDGKYDLVFPNDGSVTLLRNTSSPGNVTFAPRQNFDSGSSGFAIASGDIDGDGRLDLASANNLAPLAQRVSVIRNIGSNNVPAFAPNISLVSGRGPYAIEIADLNQDGRAELIVANNNDDGISIFRNEPQLPEVSLVSLVINPGTISPVYDPATMNYVADVPHNVADIKVIPTSNVSNAEIKVNGVTVVSGVPSFDIPLLIGSNIVNVVITLADGVTTKNYTVDIRRAKGDQAITFNTLPVKTVCDPDFAAGASSTNPNIPITYSSSNPSVATVSASGMIHLVAAGTTTITAYQSSDADFNAAIPQIRSLNVIAAVNPDVTISSNLTEVCPGNPVLFTASVTNVTTLLSYQWQADGTNIGTDSPELLVNPTDASIIYRCLVTNTASCNVIGISNGLSINLKPLVQPTVFINASNNPLLKGTEVTFTSVVVHAGSMPVYQWQVNGLDVGTNSPVFKTSALKDGDVVSCVLVSSLDCTFPVMSNVIHLTVSSQQITKIPAAFSPNNDGVNDRWVLPGFTGQPIDVLLYNRNGTLVYQSKNYLNDWDGTNNGAPLPVGTYYYIIKPKAGSKQMSGSVTIIR